MKSIKEEITSITEDVISRYSGLFDIYRKERISMLNMNRNIHEYVLKVRKVITDNDLCIERINRIILKDERIVKLYAGANITSSDPDEIAKAFSFVEQKIEIKYNSSVKELEDEIEKVRFNVLSSIS